MIHMMFKDLEVGAEFTDPLSGEQFTKTSGHTGRMNGFEGTCVADEVDCVFDDNEPVEPVESTEPVSGARSQCVCWLCTQLRKPVQPVASNTPG